MSNEIKDVYEHQYWDSRMARKIVDEVIRNPASVEVRISGLLTIFRGDAELRAIGRERSRLNREKKRSCN